MISIIIPAHNEECVIHRSLSTLLRDASPGELELVVVCNGCHDGTAEIARGFAPAVKVLETPVASKVAALNLGDEAATYFPRLFLDADVQMTVHDVRELARALAAGALAASPVPRMEIGDANWAVRAFYRIWLGLPYVREGLVGVGVYALSEAGRQRFGRFPDVINDDGYVRSLFAPHERPVVKEAQSVVTAPKTLQGLLKIMTRSRLGIYQLNQRYPELMQTERQAKSYGGAAGQLLGRPGNWPAASVYIFVNLVTRLRARRQWRSNRTHVWERDDTSRQAPPREMP